jgi:hypothetical protein
MGPPLSKTAVSITPARSWRLPSRLPTMRLEVSAPVFGSLDGKRRSVPGVWCRKLHTHRRSSRAVLLARTHSAHETAFRPAHAGRRRHAVKLGPRTGPAHMEPSGRRLAAVGGEVIFMPPWIFSIENHKKYAGCCTNIFATGGYRQASTRRARAPPRAPPPAPARRGPTPPARQGG